MERKWASELYFGFKSHPAWVSKCDFIYLSHTTNTGIFIPILAGRSAVWMQQKYTYLFKREDLPAP